MQNPVPQGAAFQPRPSAPRTKPLRFGGERYRFASLHKKAHAQLLEAEHWFKQAYQGRDAVRVSAWPEAVADEKATQVGSFAFRLDVVNALRGVLVELVGAAGDHDALGAARSRS